MTIEEDVNDTDFSPTDVLTRALGRAEEEKWQKVIILYVDEDKGFGQLCSESHTLLEMGLLFWATELMREEALRGNQDLSENE